MIEGKSMSSDSEMSSFSDTSSSNDEEIFFFLFRHDELQLLAPTRRQRVLSRGILAARSENHFWGQNSPTLSDHKIGNFTQHHFI